MEWLFQATHLNFSPQQEGYLGRCFAICRRNRSSKDQSLADIINAAILVFCISAANSDQYIAARTLYGLAIDGKAPRIFRRVDTRGVPYVALSVTALFCGLAFINLASGGPQTFSYLVASVTMFGGLTWICILIAHIHFMKAMKAQGMSRDSLPGNHLANLTLRTLPSSLLRSSCSSKVGLRSCTRSPGVLSSPTTSVCLSSS